MAAEHQVTVPSSSSPVAVGIWMTKDETNDYVRQLINSLRDGGILHISIRREGDLYRIMFLDPTQLATSDSASANWGDDSGSVLLPELVAWTGPRNDPRRAVNEKLRSFVSGTGWQVSAVTEHEPEYGSSKPAKDKDGKEQ
ncbi:hypothetical protein PG985_003334 [Apiospora marii]|uniref:uncharacterized protein n=1 Tax=Apiospora marii TaxID=335849 RepID=UPI00312DEE09